MGDRQPQLNGAYYGPSIPPPSKSYRSPGGDGGGGCCCCCGIFRCCCGCIFNCILSLICQILITILIIVAIVSLIFWFIVRPNVVKVHVTDATLSQFNFTNNNTLHYNLALNITVRNPNRRVGIYYDYIEARALYQDVRFASLNLGPFFQHHKNTSMLSPVFKGQQVMLLGPDQSSKLNEDKDSGVYRIDVRMYMKVRFKLGFFKTGKFKPKVRCGLKVPLKSHNGNSDTRCDWEYGWLWIH